MIKVLLLAGSILATLQASPIYLKNDQEIFFAFSEVTRISRNDSRVSEVFQRLRTRLPTQGHVSEMSSPMVLALVELAGSFCQVRIAEDRVLVPSRRVFHQLINFEMAPEDLSAEAITQTMSQYAQAFWLRMPTAMELEYLESTLVEAIATETETGLSAWENVLQIGCATVASSLQSILN